MSWVKEQPAKYRGKDSNCQLCYNLSRYIAIYGSARCTNEIPSLFGILGQPIRFQISVQRPLQSLLKHRFRGSTCDRIRLWLRFTWSKKLLERYHPELKSRSCDLPWLCEPGSKLKF